MRKTYKYRLYPNKEQTAKFQWILDRCREVYNAALDERKSVMRKVIPVQVHGGGVLAIKVEEKEYGEGDKKKIIARFEQQNVRMGPSITKYSQSRELTEIKHDIREEYQGINDHILRNVLERVEFAFDRFFDRCKNGEKPGYPRFRSKNRYDSFSSDSGYKIISCPGTSKKIKAMVNLQNIGAIRFKMHRPIEGKVKTYTVKREGGYWKYKEGHYEEGHWEGADWYVTFSCELEQPKPLPLSYEDVGIDLGITLYAALSDGEDIDNPRYYRSAEKKLVKLQQARARKQKPVGNRKGSNRWKKAGKQIAKHHRKTARQRKDFQNKESRKLINSYQVIVMEDLQVANMVRKPKPKQDENGTYLPNGAAAKGGLNKSINDAGWASFMQMIQVKAAWAGRTFIKVNPQYTSQTCPTCSYCAKENRQSQSSFVCQECGYTDNADHNAAGNILERGLRELREVRASDVTS